MDAHPADIAEIEASISIEEKSPPTPSEKPQLKTTAKKTAGLERRTKAPKTIRDDILETLNALDAAFGDEEDDTDMGVGQKISPNTIEEDYEKELNAIDDLELSLTRTKKNRLNGIPLNEPVRDSDILINAQSYMPLQAPYDANPVVIQQAITSAASNVAGKQELVEMTGAVRAAESGVRSRGNLSAGVTGSLGQYLGTASNASVVALCARVEAFRHALADGFIPHDDVPLGLDVCYASLAWYTDHKDEYVDYQPLYVPADIKGMAVGALISMLVEGGPGAYRWYGFSPGEDGLMPAVARFRYPGGQTKFILLSENAVRNYDDAVFGAAAIRLQSVEAARSALVRVLGESRMRLGLSAISGAAHVYKPPVYDKRQLDRPDKFSFATMHAPLRAAPREEIIRAQTQLPFEEDLLPGMKRPPNELVPNNFPRDPAQEAVWFEDMRPINHYAIGDIPEGNYHPLLLYWPRHRRLAPEEQEMYEQFRDEEMAGELPDDPTGVTTRDYIDNHLPMMPDYVRPILYQRARLLEEPTKDDIGLLQTFFGRQFWPIQFANGRTVRLPKISNIRILDDRRTLGITVEYNIDGGSQVGENVINPLLIAKPPGTTEMEWRAWSRLVHYMDWYDMQTIPEAVIEAYPDVDPSSVNREVGYRNFAGQIDALSTFTIPALELDGIVTVIGRVGFLPKIPDVPFRQYKLHDILRITRQIAADTHVLLHRVLYTSKLEPATLEYREKRGWDVFRRLPAEVRLVLHPDRFTYESMPFGSLECLENAGVLGAKRDTIGGIGYHAGNPVKELPDSRQIVPRDTADEGNVLGYDAVLRFAVDNGVPLRHCYGAKDFVAVIRNANDKIAHPFFAPLFVADDRSIVASVVSAGFELFGQLVGGKVAPTEGLAGYSKQAW